MIRIVNSLVARLTGRDDLLDQYRRYRETVVWIIRGLFRFDSKQTLIAIASNVLGGILKAGALAFLLYYANLMEKGVDITYLGYSWPSRSGPVFYFSISVALVFLITGALFVYWGNHVINALTLEFASNCSQRVLASSGGRPQRNQDPGTAFFPSSSGSGVTGIISFTRAVKPVLQVSNSLTILCYSLIVLFYLDAQLSLVIMLLVLPSLLLQYLVNFHSAQNEKDFRRSRLSARKKLDRLLGEYALVPYLFASRREWLVREYANSAIGQNLQCYYRRIMAQPRSALVSDIVLAVLSFLIVAYLGRSALMMEIGWAEFVGYLLFARICLMALRGVLVSITGFARHYPRARRLYEYFNSMDDSDTPHPVSLVVKASFDDRIGDKRKKVIEPGEPVMLFSNVPLSRLNLYAFIDVLAGGNIQTRNRLAAATRCVSRGMSSPPGGTLQELLNISSAASDEQFVQKVREFGLDSLADPARRYSLVPEDLWRAFPRNVRACVLMEQSIRDSVPVILIDSAVVDACGKHCRERWLKAQNDAMVVVVAARFRQLKRRASDVVVLMAPDRSVSIASESWCQEHESEINAWLNRHSVLEDPGDEEELLESE